MNLAEACEKFVDVVINHRLNVDDEEAVEEYNQTIKIIGKALYAGYKLCDTDALKTALLDESFIVETKQGLTKVVACRDIDSCFESVLNK